MARLILIVVFTVFGLRNAQSCCFPKQFEGLEGISGGQVVNGTGAVYQGLSNVSMDFSNKKFVMWGYFVYNDITEQIHILQDFNAGKQYFVVNGKCTAISLSGKPMNCVPPTAKKVMSTYVGIGNHKIKVDIYSYAIQNKKYILTVAPDDGCIPIYENVQIPNAMTDGGFLGLTLGIKDAKVFNVPKACLNASNGPVSQSVIGTRKHGLHSFFVRS